MKTYSQEDIDSINKMLDAIGSPVMDGMATRWRAKYPQQVEYYRDNLGKWIQVTVNDVVRFDSRLLGVNL